MFCTLGSNKRRNERQKERSRSRYSQYQHHPIQNTLSPAKSRKMKRLSHNTYGTNPSKFPDGPKLKRRLGVPIPEAGEIAMSPADAKYRFIVAPSQRAKRGARDIGRLLWSAN